MSEYGDLYESLVKKDFAKFLEVMANPEREIADQVVEDVCRQVNSGNLADETIQWLAQMQSIENLRSSAVIRTITQLFKIQNSTVPPCSTRKYL